MSEAILQYQQCVNCVMDTTDPLITFNISGVCNHCLEYRKYTEMHQLRGKDATIATEQMVREIKMSGRGKEYDCIMGISGGVDSSYLAYYASKISGLRVLLVHVDTGWNSELAVQNIENIVKTLKLDLHTFVVDWEEMRDLQRAFFLSSVPNCDIPQDHAFLAALYQEAKKYGLRHILNGGNMATESILPAAWGYDASDWIHIKDIHKRFGRVRLKQYPRIGFLKYRIIYPNIYRLRIHRPLEYVDYKKAEVKEFLKNELSWRDYGGKHFESKFTQFFQSYYLPVKYGYDKRLAHLSSLIVSGQITKEQAMVELRNLAYDPRKIEDDKEYFIKKLGFTSSEWEKIMNMPPKSEKDYSNQLSYLRVYKFLFSILYPIVRKIKGILG